MTVLAPERNREHSIGDQAVTLNVGFMERLPISELSSEFLRKPCSMRSWCRARNAVTVTIGSPSVMFMQVTGYSIHAAIIMTTPELSST